MEHKAVTSTSIHSIGYDPKTQELQVRYKGSGKTYSYQGVGCRDHLELEMAKSKGSHVQNVIQKKFKGREA